MENDIVMYAAGYVFIRVALFSAIGYAFYRVLRSQRLATASGKASLMAAGSGALATRRALLSAPAQHITAR